MPERSDEYKNLIPYHRRAVDENFAKAEESFNEYMELAGQTNPTLKEVYISGWNQHRYVSKKLYTLEEVKEIIN
jgi:hypothetical protein